MSNISIKNALMIFMSCLIILFAFCGCNSNSSFDFEREYLDDLHIPLETHPAEIIIKEWRYLLGSGAEVYYKADGKEILLGQLSGADDGFCPFKEGLYAVTVDGNKLTIEWCGYPRCPRDSWSKKNFELPSN